MCSLIICDKNGHPFWFGSTQLIKKGMGAASGSEVSATTNVEATVPLNLPDSQKFELRIEVRDSNDQNNRAMPRAYVVPEVEQVRTPQECLARLADKSFDARRKVVVETKTMDASLKFFFGQKASQTPGNASILIDKPNYVSISTDVSYDGILVLADMFFPGWEARVDGRKADVFCANYAFRGVRPFRIGTALLIAFILIAPAALVLSRRRSRKRH